MECDVRAICVFDGKERSLAKELEVSLYTCSSRRVPDWRQIERRRHVRRLTAARGALELERLERLRKLAGLLQMFRTLGPSAQDQIARALRELTSTSDGLPPHAPPVPSWLPTVEPWKTVKEPQPPKHIIHNFITPYEVFGRLDNSDISDVLNHDSAATTVSVV